MQVYSLIDDDFVSEDIDVKYGHLSVNILHKFDDVSVVRKDGANGLYWIHLYHLNKISNESKLFNVYLVSPKSSNGSKRFLRGIVRKLFTYNTESKTIHKNSLPHQSSLENVFIPSN